MPVHLIVIRSIREVETGIMNKPLVKSLIKSAKLHVDQRGITGLETAIVLIAFVVVASVFAFAVLSTGLLSSEKSKEFTIQVKPNKGAVVIVNRTTPPELEAIMELN